MKNEDGQKSHLSETMEIVTVPDDTIVLQQEQMAITSPHGIPSPGESIPPPVERWQEKIPSKELIPLAMWSKKWLDSFDAMKQDRQNVVLERRAEEDQKMFFKVWYSVTAKYDEALAGELMKKYRDSPEVQAALNQL